MKQHISDKVGNKTNVNNKTNVYENKTNCDVKLAEIVKRPRY